MDTSKPRKPPTLGEALREIGRHFKAGLSEALAAANAERAAQAPTASPAPGPESRLTPEERARLERLLRSWPGKGREDAQA